MADDEPSWSSILCEVDRDFNRHQRTRHNKRIENANIMSDKQQHLQEQPRSIVSYDVIGER